DLIHFAAVHTACLSLRLLDEMAEERGAWRKRHMVDVAVQGLVHSEHELSHIPSFNNVSHTISRAEVDISFSQSYTLTREKNFSHLALFSLQSAPIPRKGESVVCRIKRLWHRFGDR